MTYELEKELRDAGLILEGDSLPTLSELIEACGGYKGHFKLIHVDGGWCAAKGRNDSEGYTINLPTPEEAVARLYIALQVSPSL